MKLPDLPDGARAVVEGVVSSHPMIDATALRRLEELGFLEGEPLTVLRRGPGGVEPIAVQVGDTQFALRMLEAQCIAVRLA